MIPIPPFEPTVEGFLSFFVWSVIIGGGLFLVIYAISRRVLQRMISCMATTSLKRMRSLTILAGFGFFILANIFALPWYGVGASTACLFTGGILTKIGVNFDNLTSYASCAGTHNTFFFAAGGSLLISGVFSIS